MLITPELERVAFEPLPHLSERDKIHAAAMAVCELMRLGNVSLDAVTPDDKAVAQSIFEQGRPITQHELKKPGLVLHLEALLSQYDYDIVRDAVQLRRYVTNKLLEESENADPRIRLRALENLGKIGDVGLFVERHEVTVAHTTTEELEARLHKLLEPLKDIEYTVVKESPVVTKQAEVDAALTAIEKLSAPQAAVPEPADD